MPLSSKAGKPYRKKWISSAIKAAVSSAWNTGRVPSKVVEGQERH
jgi:hypothetical protein